MHPVSLRGRKITLREFVPEDVDAALHVVGDDRVTKWLSFDSRSPKATREMLNGAVLRASTEPRAEYYLAVDEAGHLVGFTRLGLGGVKAAKLGYAIRADRWGHGLATDACRTIIEFGFANLGLHRITAAIGPDNAASIAVATRLGMTHEGRLRDHVFTNGAWRDSELYSLLSTQWTGSGDPDLVRRLEQ